MWKTWLRKWSESGLCTIEYVNMYTVRFSDVLTFVFFCVTV